MRLIDADALKNLPFERMIHTDFGDTAVPIEEIDNAPTIVPFAQVEYETFREYERPHGEWKYLETTENLPYGGRLTKRGWVCSYCGFFRRKKSEMSKFCESCGAEMKGATDETD